jgi:glycosyltransferase involved in cell wall biosynthesis
MRPTRKRLGYFINCFPNFIEAMIYREVLALRARGFDLTTFSIRRPEPADVPREAQALAASTIYILPAGILPLIIAHVAAFARAPLRYLRTLLEVVGGTHGSAGDRFRTLCHFVEGIAIMRRVEALGIEHLHAHWAVGSTTVAMVVSRMLDIPFTFTAHAYDIWLDKLLLPEKVHAANMVLTCTDYNRRHLIEAYGADPANVRVVYHGLDLERFRRQSRPANPRPVILSVGRLVEQKGYEDLIRTCGDLVQEGVEFECEIVGDGPLRGRLEQVVAELGLQDVVRLPGRIVGDAILDCYARADVFALFCVEASDGDRDGIPNTMIEAMAMELPVASTRYTGVPELVAEGATGFLADCGDRPAMVEALRRLLTDPDLRARMGRDGRARVLSDFATAVCLANLETVFATDFRSPRLASPQRAKPAPA